MSNGIKIEQRRSLFWEEKTWCMELINKISLIQPLKFDYLVNWNLFNCSLMLLLIYVILIQFTLFILSLVVYCPNFVFACSAGFY